MPNVSVLASFIVSRKDYMLLWVIEYNAWFHTGRQMVDLTSLGLMVGSMRLGTRMRGNRGLQAGSLLSW